MKTNLKKLIKEAKYLYEVAMPETLMKTKLHDHYKKLKLLAKELQQQQKKQVSTGHILKPFIYIEEIQGQ